MSPYYEGKLALRMTTRGISRSEAIRQVIDESEASGGKAFGLIRGHNQIIRMAVIQLRRVTGNSYVEIFDRIDTAVREIDSLLGG